MFRIKKKIVEDLRLSSFTFYFFFLQYEYKLDREFLKGCKLSVTDDKNTVLALNNAILASDVSTWNTHFFVLLELHLLHKLLYWKYDWVKKEALKSCSQSHFIFWFDLFISLTNWQNLNKFGLVNVTGLVHGLSKHSKLTVPEHPRPLVYLCIPVIDMKILSGENNKKGCRCNLCITQSIFNNY